MEKIIMNISSILVFGGLIGLGIMGIISMINTRKQLRQFEKTINRIDEKLNKSQSQIDYESESDKQSKRDKEYLERTNRVMKSISHLL